MVAVLPFRIAAAAKPLIFCEAIGMYAGFCEERERGSVLDVHDRANDEQGAADAEWQSKKMVAGLSAEALAEAEPRRRRRA